MKRFAENTSRPNLKFAYQFPRPGFVFSVNIVTTHGDRSETKDLPCYDEEVLKASPTLHTFTRLITSTIILSFTVISKQHIMDHRNRYKRPARPPARRPRSRAQAACVSCKERKLKVTFPHLKLFSFPWAEIHDSVMIKHLLVSTASVSNMVRTKYPLLRV